MKVPSRQPTMMTKSTSICASQLSKNDTLATNHHLHSTALSTEYWRLKNAGQDPKITWRVVETSRAFKPELKKCHLCLAEKYRIATFQDQEHLLNKRSEIVAKCRHRRKYELSLFDTAD